MSVVYLQQAGADLEAMRSDFRVIKSLGFAGLKQVLLRAGLAVSPEEALAAQQAIYSAALDEGLSPWWSVQCSRLSVISLVSVCGRRYGIGGWEAITPELLQQLGIPVPADINASATMAALQRDPRLQVEGEMLFLLPAEDGGFFLSFFLFFLLGSSRDRRIMSKSTGIAFRGWGHSRPASVRLENRLATRCR